MVLPISARRLFALLAVFTACAPRSDTRPNILLIVVDTLRSDHLSSYGYGRATSPAIDALAARGARFDRNRAQAPCTFPSMNSLLTSRPVEAFFGQPIGDMSIPTGIATVAEFLHAGGYVTAAFSASPIVRKNPTNFNTVGGFDRGFQLFDDECVWKDARCVNDRAMAALSRHHTGEPVFLFLHYIDPHGPYEPPAEGGRRFSRSSAQGDLSPEGRAASPDEAARRIDRGEPLGVSAADIGHWVNLYDDEIAFVDKRVGEMIEAFEKSAPPRGTIVAFAADHGESFLEHGTLVHCQTLFDTEIRTPLIFAGPGIPNGEVLDTLSENLDIVPTLLDFAGVRLAATAFSGRSLRPSIEGRSAAGPARLQTSAFNAWRAAFDGRHKLIVNEEKEILRLYDLTQDSGETVDLSASDRRRAADLRRALAEQSPASASALESARETERHLRALGYL